LLFIFVVALMFNAERSPKALEWDGAQSVIKPGFESPVRLPRGAENIGPSLYYQQLTL
jgi:hypothetical protein